MEKPVAFGQARLHEKLDSGQLAALMQLHPNLRSSEKFNVAYLTKLRPGEGTDFRRDPKAHAAHLEKCRDHVLTLPPALMSLKAHVLHHHLRMQQSLGRYPLEDFRAYLALPRTRHPILRQPGDEVTSFIRTDVDYSAATGCQWFGDDSTFSLMRAENRCLLPVSGWAWKPSPQTHAGPSPSPTHPIKPSPKA